ncbi:MAG: hypothetical protein R2706_06470 [Acidimicrobiales bacterium]
MLVLGAVVAVLFPEHEFERGRGTTWAEAAGVLRAGVKLVRVERVVLGVFSRRPDRHGVRGY